MKAIILAAGEGRRLRPFTDTMPKCMVQYKNQPMIKHTLDCMKSCGINDISVVTGYKKEVLKDYINDKSIKYYTNEIYSLTNMVYTLFCAEQEMDDDVIISYSDIVYTEEVLISLLKSQGDFSVVVDKGWRILWEQRMDDPLLDAETMKIDEDSNILELGKKASSYDDIEGQYIGLIKISKNIIHKVKDFYKQLTTQANNDGKNEAFKNMYMTTFIQLLIDNSFEVQAVTINGGWIEIDTLDDLEKLKDYDWTCQYAYN